MLEASCSKEKGNMESFQLTKYGWARDLALKIIGEDSGVIVVRVESIPPSPDRDVILWIYDNSLDLSWEIKLRTAEFDLNDEPDREDKVRMWAVDTKAEIERRR